MSTQHSSMQWQISTSVKVILEHFRWLSPLSRYSHFRNHNLENVGQGHDVRRSQQIPDFLSDGKAIVMFALSLSVYEIFGI